MILGLCDDELAVSLKTLKEHCKGKSGRCCVFDQSADPAVRPSTDKAYELISECFACKESKDKDEATEFFVAEYNFSILNFHEVLDATDEGMDLKDEEMEGVDEIEQLRQRVITCITCGEDPSTNALPAPAPSAPRKRFAFDFRIQNRATNYMRKPVCPSCWRGLYGFSKYKMAMQSTKLKESNSMHPNPHPVSQYNDRTLHDFSHKDTVAMLTENGTGVLQGEAAPGCRPLLC
jgi:hypothetical protein